MVDRRWKTNVEMGPNCPRCNSSNTKFSYYNNYSLSQPRYFCKGCRRYWTKGGSLRNVPVGGGCRKNHRAKLVRLSGDQVAGRDSRYGRRLSGQIRPDLALDSMVGNSSSVLHSINVSATTTDGFTNDLVLLSQRPEVEPVSELPRATDDSFHSTRGPGEANSNQPMPVHLPNNKGFTLWQRSREATAEALLSNGNQSSFGELDFLVDPRGYESLALPCEGVRSIFTSNCPVVPNSTCEAATYQGFGSLLEDSMYGSSSLAYLL